MSTYNRTLARRQWRENMKEKGIPFSIRHWMGQSFSVFTGRTQTGHRNKPGPQPKIAFYLPVAGR